MKVQEILTENPVALALLIGRLLASKMHYAKNITGATRPAAQAIQKVRSGVRGKSGELNPSREQLEALARQGRTIEDSLSYLRSRAAAGPAQGTRGPEAAQQAIKTATKEIRNIIKDVPVK